MTPNAASLFLRPHVSEKTYSQSENNVYAFSVPISTNKQDVKDAIEEQFGVSVLKVRSHIIKGKTKRSMRKRAQPIDGKRARTKRIYVTIKDGDSIPVFEEAA